MQPSPWALLRNRVYRNLFIAQVVSNLGTWMQNVAAQWFLVEEHSSAVIVALVQTASLGPTLLLGLFAGALADLFDRRRYLIFMQSYAVVVTLALAVLTHLGRLGPRRAPCSLRQRGDASRLRCYEPAEQKGCR